VAAEGKAIDALSQFELSPVLGVLGNAVNFSQANLFMVIAVLLTMGQGMVREQVGDEGKKYFPFVFCIFMFVLFGNLLGMLPYAFTFTSHIAVTFALAMIVFVLITVVAISIHGMHFFSYFFPEGAPKVLAPLIIPIEVISYLSRPVSLSVRLFANMVAGHVMLKVFATFVVLMGSAGVVGIFGAAAPLAVNVALVGFEFLVAFLQAYVFAILTSIYLHDAVHLH
jgi:F-type H+-transporting ATPase subunit a